MTLEELLNANADELDAIPPDELERYFRQFFPTTRPELAQKLSAPISGNSHRRTSSQPAPQLSSQQQQVLLKMAEAGIDISFATKPIRRK